MTASAFVLPALAVGAVSLLTSAGAAHVGHRERLRATLARQAMVPQPAHLVLSRLLGPLEVGLGVAGALHLATSTPALAGPAIIAMGTAFLAYLATLLRIRPGTPCGCGGDQNRAGPNDLGRPALVIAGGVALSAGADLRLAGLAGPQRATTILAGIALALAVDLFARANPPVVRPTPVLGRRP